MAVTYLQSGSKHYVQINGVIGSKVCRNRQEAETYADRVIRGLVVFEKLSTLVKKNFDNHRLELNG